MHDAEPGQVRLPDIQVRALRYGESDVVQPHGPLIKAARRTVGVGIEPDHQAGVAGKQNHHGPAGQLDAFDLLQPKHLFIPSRAGLNV